MNGDPIPKHIAKKIQRRLEENGGEKKEEDKKKKEVKVDVSFFIS